MNIRHINFLALSISQVFSNLCDKALIVGFSWFILTTYSKHDLALFFIITMLPHFFMSFVSGKIINRLSPISAMRYMEFFRASVIGVLALCLLFIKPNFWVLTTLVTIANLFAAIFDPALMTVPKQLALETKDYQRILGLLNSCSSIAKMVGPILAVPLYQYCGLLGLISCATVFYFLAWVVELFIKASSWESVSDTDSQVTRVQFCKDFVKQYKIIFILFFVFFLINMVVIPIQLFMPMIVNEMLHANIHLLSVLESALGAGFLAGALVISLFPTNDKPWKLICIPYILVGFIYICIAFMTGEYLISVYMFLFGALLSIGNINTVSFYQINTSKNDTAVVMSILNFISNASGPLAMMIAALVISLLSFHSLLVCYASLCLLMGASLIFIKDLRRLES